MVTVLAEDGDAGANGTVAYALDSQGDDENSSAGAEKRPDVHL